MQILNKNVADLIFAEYNPRQLTQKQHKDLTDSIKRFGLVDPIIVNIHSDRENVIVGGHQRVRIAQEMGIMDVPCVEVNLDTDKEKELNIRLNKNLGEWDMDALANCFDESELLEWGFDVAELGMLGDVVEIGCHKLMCGDATKKEDVQKLMSGQSADMVFTDPPYDLDDLYSQNIFDVVKDDCHVFIMNSDKKLVDVVNTGYKWFRIFFVVDFKVARVG